MRMAASPSPSPSPSAAVRSWRTAFLTEGRNPHESSSCHRRRRHLLLYHSPTPSASNLLKFSFFYLRRARTSSTRDLLFLLELVATRCHVEQDMTATFSYTSHLIRDIWRHVSFEINSSSWTLILDSFAKMLDYLLNKAAPIATADSSANAATISPVMDYLELIRCPISVQVNKFSPAENAQLVKFLLRVIVGSHTALISSSHSITYEIRSAEMGKRVPRNSSLWEFQTVAFAMLADTVSRAGSSIPADVWKSIIEESDGFLGI